MTVVFDRRVLSLCDRTGVMVEPWLEAGFDCTTVDLQHRTQTTTRANGAQLTTLYGDVCDVRLPGGPYAIVFAFPPCTDLANSGARWMPGKGLGALIEALQIVEACRAVCDTSGVPWMIENPMGQLSTYWRKPDMVFDPYEFAGYLDEPEQDFYTKRTCLWVGGGFQLPRKRPWGAGEEKAPSRMHLMSPGPDRADERAVTPAGFARAVFEANVGLVKERAA